MSAAFLLSYSHGLFKAKGPEGASWVSITHNLRVGTTPGGIDVMSPEANVATGWRRVARVGNAGCDEFWMVDAACIRGRGVHRE